MRASLFVTCLTDLFRPQIAVAMVRVLRRLGVEVDCPAGQTCCGQPAYNNGFFEEARSVARRMLDVFEGCDLVVTPSASCCAMIRNHYCHLFADQPHLQRRARALAERTFEFVELLVRKLQVDWSAWPLRLEGTATYHHSCHLRALGLTDEVIELLGRIEGLRYRPMEKFDQCCGFGGTFAVRYPQISSAMVGDKVDCIAATGAQTVVCIDTGCSMNIAGACRRRGLPVRLRHIAELLDEAMVAGRGR